MDSVLGLGASCVSIGKMLDRASDAPNVYRSHKNLNAERGREGMKRRCPREELWTQKVWETVPLQGSRGGGGAQVGLPKFSMMFLLA